MQAAGRPNGQHKKATAERWPEKREEDGVSCFLAAQ